MSTKLKFLQSRITESQITSIMVQDYKYLTAQYQDCVASNKEAKRIALAAAKLSGDQKAYYVKQKPVHSLTIDHFVSTEVHQAILDGKVVLLSELMSRSTISELLSKQNKESVEVDELPATVILNGKKYSILRTSVWWLGHYVCSNYDNLMKAEETKKLRMTPAQRRRMLMNINVPVYLENMPRHISQGDFIKRNFDTYRLCIESWICLFREGISHSTQPDSKRLYLDEARINFYFDLMLRKGLIAVISDAKEASDAFISFINGNDLILSRTNPFFEDVSLWRLRGEDPASVLQILRYPKRLSIEGTTAAAYEAAIEFKVTNNEHRQREMSNWSSYQWHYVLRIRKVLEKMFATVKEPLSVSECYEVAKDRGYFSSGSVTGSSSKAMAAKAIQAELEGVMNGHGAVYGSSFTDCVSKKHYKGWYKGPMTTSSYLDEKRKNTRYSEFHTVPKTAWAVRAICYEQAGRQFLQQGFRGFLESVVETFGCVDLHDQSKNRDACIQGSKYRDTVTIDLSHASDSISWKDIYDCFPNWIVAMFHVLRAPKIRMDQEVFRNNVAWTSGAGLCFFTETIFFLACAIVGIMEIRERQGKRPWPTKTELARCFQYGDDGVYPTEYADNIIRVLCIMGFTVNMDKSYSSKTDSYRESCGEEAYNGIPLSGDYFPRKPMDLESDERLLSLISLQHRFFNSPTMGLFFIKAVETVKKNAVTCLPNIEDSTPWYPYDIPQVYYSKDTQSLYIKTMRFETVYSSASLKELDRIGEILGYGQFLEYGTHADYEGGLRIVKPLNHRSLSGDPTVSCSIKTIPFVIEGYPISFKCDDEVITLNSEAELIEFCRRKFKEKPAKPTNSNKVKKGKATNAQKKCASSKAQKDTEKSKLSKRVQSNKKPNNPHTGRKTR